MATTCALNADGNLKNASDIEFYESESDERPIRDGEHTADGESENKGKTSPCPFLSTFIQR